MIFGVRALEAERLRLVARCDALRSDLVAAAVQVGGKVAAADRILTALRRLPGLLARAALVWSLFRR